MVPVSSIVAIVAVLLLTVFGPIGLAIFYAVRNKNQGIIPAWLLGAAGFFVMQVVIRLPILSALSFLPGFVSFANNNYVLYAIILAFTAGLFELIGRYVVAKVLNKKGITYPKSISAGLGHGGIEAIVLVGMTYMSNLAYVVMINTGSFDAAINQVAALGMDITPYIQLKETLVGASPSLYLLAGYERILTIICHLAMSLIVCYFVAKKQDGKGILICLGLHTLLDMGAGLIPYFVPTSGNTAIAGYVVIYTFLTVFTVLSVFIICQLRKRFADIA